MASARRMSGIASASRFVAWSNKARLVRRMTTFGWSLPKEVSSMASARRMSGSASASRFTRDRDVDPAPCRPVDPTRCQTAPVSAPGIRRIDLNADLGEGFGVWRLGDDDALLGIVSSANVACGFHAGDPSTMRRVCTRAAAGGVAVGAQVSYRDLAGFGRRFLDVEPAELADDLLYQLAALDGIARSAGMYRGNAWIDVPVWKRSSAFHPPWTGIARVVS